MEDIAAGKRFDKFINVWTRYEVFHHRYCPTLHHKIIHITHNVICYYDSNVSKQCSISKQKCTAWRVRTSSSRVWLHGSWTTSHWHGPSPKNTSHQSSTHMTASHTWALVFGRAGLGLCPLVAKEGMALYNYTTQRERSTPASTHASCLPFRLNMWFTQESTSFQRLVRAHYTTSKVIQILKWPPC